MAARKTRRAKKQATRRPKKRAPRKPRRRKRSLGIASPAIQKRADAEVTVPRGLVKDWPRLSTSEDHDYRIFRTRFDVSVNPRNGVEHRFVVLESVDWVNVIPITPEGNVVFIEQYRHGIRATTLEVPGGMVDTGETPAHAAVRELSEETGYAGGDPVPLGWIHPNPAVQENRCWSYVVRGAVKARAAHTEGTEDIAVVEVPLDQVPRLIATGRITHALVVVAFQFLWLREGRKSAAKG